MSARRIDLLVGLALAFAATVLIGVSAQELGFTRDEGYYFKAAESYWGWYKELAHNPAHALTDDAIDKSWSYNHEHPAGMKMLFAWGFGFRDLTGFPAEIHDAIRFPAWCIAGLSVAFVFWLARSFLSRRASLLAAAMWIAMPHVFWHMHVACFDVGIACAQTWLVLAYWHGRRSTAGALLCGVAFALAAAVKHNVLPVPALLVLHWAVCEADWGRASSGTSLRLPRIPLAFFAMALLSPALYLLHWPWLWPDPIRRFGQYIGYHLSHENYPILYFGDLLTHPPFPVSFPFVMSAVTVPVPILALFVVGFTLACVVAGRLVWHRLARPLREPEITRVPLAVSSGSPAFLLAMNALFPFVLIALPSTPIFGGTKHWMNALPFLCVLGAWALEEGVARLRHTQHARVFVAVAVLVVLPGAFISARVWPYGLGSYNELIGFARGAANVGMQRTFWGYEPRAALPVINARTLKNGRIHFGDTNPDDWKMYRRDHLLRDDITFSSTVAGAAVASVQPQGEFKDQWMDVWNEWDDRSPDLVLGPEGVPVCTVTFHNEGARADP